jgi:amidase
VIGAFPDDDAALRDPDRAAAYRGVLDMLDALGFPVYEVTSAELSAARRLAADVFRDFACLTAAAGLASMTPAPEPGDLEPMTLAAADRGRNLGAAGAVAAFQAMGKVSRMVEMLFSEIDVLITPMLSTAPPRLGAFPTDHDDVEAHFDAFNAFAPWAAMCNVGGQPAASVPMGLDRDGLPMAVQVIAPMGGDLELLEVANILERLNPWPRFAPIAGFDG